MRALLVLGELLELLDLLLVRSDLLKDLHTLQSRLSRSMLGRGGEGKGGEGRGGEGRGGERRREGRGAEERGGEDVIPISFLYEAITVCYNLH